MKKGFIVVFGIIVGLFFFFKQIYLKPYDHTYAKDYYDHSQWTIPHSTRIIGDDLLYQVAGYELVNTWNMFTIAPQVPPLGKYLYGFSIRFFQNAQIASLVLFLFSLYFYYLILKQIFSSHTQRLVALFLFITEPLLFRQATVSMLDLPQLLTLLIHTFFVLKLIDKKNHRGGLLYAVFAGISLGLIISIKIGFFGVFILLVDTFILWQTKKLVYVFPLVLIIPVTYALTYLPFFLSNHSLIDFLKTQKWMLNFWFSSGLKPIYGIVFISLLGGWIKQSFYGATWERVHEWTVMWPLYLVSFFYTLFLSFRQKKLVRNHQIDYILLMLGAMMMFCAVAPFNARYLTISMPFFILLFVRLIGKILIILLIGIIFVMQVVVFLSPGPSEMMKIANQIWSAGYYQDLYNYLDKKTADAKKRVYFWREMQAFEKKLGVQKRTVEITAPYTFPWDARVRGTLKIIYTTPLGEIRNTQPILLTKEQNDWKIKWEDSLLLNDYALNDEIIASYQLGRYGKILTAEGIILSKEEDWPFLLVIPERIKNEQVVQNQLSLLTGLKKYELEWLYKMNNQPDWPVEIGFLRLDLSPHTLDTIKLDSAILVEQRKTRTGKLSLFQDKINPQLGGTIQIKKSNGQMIELINKKPIDGYDITIQL